MDGVPVSSFLLKEKTFCKFMSKHDIKNYLRQSTKTLSICFQYNATHTDLLMCHYFLLKCLYQIWSSKEKKV